MKIGMIKNVVAMSVILW